MNDEPCCEWHNRNCEPPSELCCGDCTEYHHGWHRCHLGEDWTGHHGHPEECIAPDAAVARAEGLAAQVAAVEVVCDGASGDHIGGVSVVRVPLVRAALAARPVTDDKAGDR